MSTKNADRGYMMYAGLYAYELVLCIICITSRSDIRAYILCIICILRARTCVL